MRSSSPPPPPPRQETANEADGAQEATNELAGAQATANNEQAITHEQISVTLNTSDAPTDEPTDEPTDCQGRAARSPSAEEMGFEVV